MPTKPIPNLELLELVESLLVAPYCAILRYYRCDTPYRAILFQGKSTPPKWCDTPPWYLVSHRHICAIPHFATYRAIIVQYCTKTSTKEFCDTIAASIAQCEKYRYWASKESLVRSGKVGPSSGRECRDSKESRDCPQRREPFCNDHPAARGVRQKESDKKMTKKGDRSVRESDREATKNEKEMIELLLPTPFCGTLSPKNLLRLF